MSLNLDGSMSLRMIVQLTSFNDDFCRLLLCWVSGVISHFTNYISPKKFQSLDLRFQLKKKLLNKHLQSKNVNIIASVYSFHCLKLLKSVVSVSLLRLSPLMRMQIKAGEESCLGRPNRRATSKYIPSMWNSNNKIIGWCGMHSIDKSTIKVWTLIRPF